MDWRRKYRIKPITRHLVFTLNLWKLDMEHVHLHFTGENIAEQKFLDHLFWNISSKAKQLKLYSRTDLCGTKSQTKFATKILSTYLVFFLYFLTFVFVHIYVYMFSVCHVHRVWVEDHVKSIWYRNDWQIWPTYCRFCELLGFSGRTISALNCWSTSTAWHHF